MWTKEPLPLLTLTLGWGYGDHLVFNFEKNKETLEEEVILIDIGGHDEVYLPQRLTKSGVFTYGFDRWIG